MFIYAENSMGLAVKSRWSELGRPFLLIFTLQVNPSTSPVTPFLLMNNLSGSDITGG